MCGVPLELPHIPPPYQVLYRALPVFLRDSARLGRAEMLDSNRQGLEVEHRPSVRCVRRIGHHALFWSIRSRWSLRSSIDGLSVRSILPESSGGGGRRSR